MLRSILIGLDESPYSTAAVELGLRWARRFDCLLVGVGVVDEPEIRGAGKISESYRPVYERLVEEARQRVDRLLERFALRATEAGVSHKLLEDVGLPWEALLREAQRYDLVLSGQETHFNFETSSRPCRTLEKLLHRTPRPVVVTPKDAKPGDGVLIAFDGSAQSARALHLFVCSGLHALGRCYVFSQHDSDKVIAAQTADRAVEFLAAHEIAAEPIAAAAGDPSSKTIVEEAAHRDVELVVMGAHGKSAFKELLLGSVTRNVLQATDRPVFLYH